MRPDPHGYWRHPLPVPGKTRLQTRASDECTKSRTRLREFGHEPSPRRRARSTNAPLPGIRDRGIRSSFLLTAVSGLTPAPMKFAASTPAFERALSVEIAASEQIRMRVLAGMLAILFLGDQLLFLFARETLEQFAGRLLPTWLPLNVFGPFLAYEIVALVVLRYRGGRGKSMPTAARFANAVIETSLPTVILWWMNQFTSPLVAFGAWPTLLYFVFIIASTLRLDFVLPAFTGAVAAVSYLGMACWVLSFGAVVANPISYVSKAAMMVVAGVVADLRALRLPVKFR